MSIKHIYAQAVPEGNGVTVKRLMPIHGLRNFDPFVLWDHFDIESGGIGAGDQHVAHGEALLVENETSLSMVAKDSAHILWCFGLPHGEPIIQHGPFVD